MSGKLTFLWDGLLSPPFRGRAEAATYYHIHRAPIPDPFNVQAAVGLEEELRKGFSLPAGCTVFAAFRHDENSFAPPVPLVVISTLVDVRVEASIELEVICRPQASVARAPRPPPPAVELSDGRAVVGSLRTNGYVIVRFDGKLRDLCRRSFEALASISIDTHRGIMLIDGSNGPRSKRSVGFAEDATRRWLQLRRGLGREGHCLPRDSPAVLHELFFALEACCRTALGAIETELGLSASSLVGLLDPEPFSDPRHGPRPLAGASVMRAIQYKRSERAMRVGGAHTDLGLVTLMPVSSAPGLQGWDVERLGWDDVEATAADRGHAVLFGGEALSYVAGLPALVHRVSTRSRQVGPLRVSLPFFCRPRPDAVLSQVGLAHSGRNDALPLTVADFNVNRQYARRPWRSPPSDESLPDF